MPELRSNDAPIKLSDIFGQINCIKLETTNETLMSDGVAGITEYKKHIYVYERRNKPGLNVGNYTWVYNFETNGKFVNKIGNHV